ncbi:MAG: hypothetical protein J0L70_04985 [Leptolyngbya sp. UWPOB_LEPTO1]|uniref:hypothetical protein n=1 Tax=Leptolyngbya sp. UWPOB_LEPTO1 TaxID=2815653 RepID=UPI001AD34B10|nr:hypothetical protein [Leptolyngbya sp. UWPOB_LEPTO1]MBN8559856.1 hypothetical protein [Leptolyngbya sp. UWPOB_LEPTO1]
MGVRIKSLFSAIALSASSSLMAIAASAQEAPVFRPNETIPNAIDRAYFGALGEFSDRNPLRYTQTIIGTPYGYPENQISRDGERIHRIYLDLMNQQNSSDPLIRTADLPNPFNLSVQTLPTSGNPVVGSEFAIEQPLDPQFPVQPMTPPNSLLPQRY